MGKQEDPRLTPIQREILLRIEGCIRESQPATLEKAAKMILSEQARAGDQKTFQERLKLVALTWRERYEIVRKQMNRLAEGDGARLYKASRAWAEDDSLFARNFESDSPFEPQPMRPSLRPRMPREPITEEEFLDFLKLLDRAGVERVFAPGAQVNGEEVTLQPLIKLGETPVLYTSVAVLYDGAGFERPWDGSRRHPEIALGLDLALLAAATEGKWTHFVCDLYFSRLPQWHRYHSRNGPRPPWRQGTRKLQKIGLMEHVKGRTWRLTDEGKRVAVEQIMPSWCTAARTGNSEQ